MGCFILERSQPNISRKNILDHLKKHFSFIRKSKILNHQKIKLIIMKTTIIGLGYIGLPTSVIIANRNNRVFGIDINKNLVSEINNNKLITFEPGLKSLLNSVIKKIIFLAYPNSKADFYLIVVPTPFNENKQPNLSFVNEALFSTIPYLKEGDTLIIESNFLSELLIKLQKKFSK